MTVNNAYCISPICACKCQPYQPAPAKLFKIVEPVQEIFHNGSAGFGRVRYHMIKELSTSLLSCINIKNFDQFIHLALVIKFAIVVRMILREIHA